MTPWKLCMLLASFCMVLILTYHCSIFHSSFSVNHQDELSSKTCITNFTFIFSVRNRRVAVENEAPLQLPPWN